MSMTIGFALYNEITGHQGDTKGTLPPCETQIDRAVPWDARPPCAALKISHFMAYVKRLEDIKEKENVPLLTTVLV
jgi:hypothetical protein